MLVKLILGVAGDLWALPPNACASENVTSSCVDVSVPRNAVIARNGQWIELTSKQWQFLRSVYVLNPQTPPGFALWRQGSVGAARQGCRRTGVLYRR